MGTLIEKEPSCTHKTNRTLIDWSGGGTHTRTRKVRERESRQQGDPIFADGRGRRRRGRGRGRHGIEEGCDLSCKKVV